MARRIQTGTEPAEQEAGDLDAPVGMTFHYAVPAELEVVLQAGHLVWAPFGREELHGIVLALVDETPEGVRPRTLLDLVTPDPVCTQAQLNLARWLSGAYLAPVLDCLLLMLPPGLSFNAISKKALAASATARLPPMSPPLASATAAMRGASSAPVVVVLPVVMPRPLCSLLRSVRQL